MSRFLSKRLSGLVPYVPGEQPQNRQYIKLNTNESPFPPSPKALEALKNEGERLNLYPDPEGKELISAIANRYCVPADMVFLGNGSDEILAFCFMAFCDQNIGVCYPDISYGFYKVYKDLCCLDGKEIPLQKDFSINPSDYFAKNRTIFIANPNAPTGMTLSTAEIEGILKSNPNNMVVIDEAYVDFGGESVIPLTLKYNNLIVVCTFSKSRNLAGARLGFSVASPALTADLNTIKFSFNPYNINRLTLATGKAAMDDEEYFKACTNTIIENREYTTTALKELGFLVLPSKTNFLFAKSDRIGGKKLYLKLKEKGILVRHFGNDRIKDFVRITIGQKTDMDALLSAIKQLLEEAK